jgi:hypothetical protein
MPETRATICPTCGSSKNRKTGGPWLDDCTWRVTYRCLGCGTQHHVTTDSGRLGTVTVEEITPEVEAKARAKFLNPHGAVSYYPPRVLSRGKWHTIRLRHRKVLPEFRFHAVLSSVPARGWTPSLRITVWRVEISLHRYV